uniref:Uncharacterized protein n=1 Tax=Anguilla anguilla TaxID=7936 RepID=A0A0E9VQY0_ANGAN
MNILYFGYEFPAKIIQLQMQ